MPLFDINAWLDTLETDGIDIEAFPELIIDYTGSQRAQRLDRIQVDTSKALDTATGAKIAVSGVAVVVFLVLAAIVILWSGK